MLKADEIEIDVRSNPTKKDQLDFKLHFGRSGCLRLLFPVLRGIVVGYLGMGFAYQGKIMEKEKEYGS